MPGEFKIRQSRFGESHRTVVLGAGPAGLAAAIPLARAGQRPLIIEASDSPGGMMRGVKLADCQVDLGRKEIYERIPLVKSFWEELLQDQFVSYPHRTGILYRGSILERATTWRKPFRGASSSFVSRAAVSFLKNRISSVCVLPPRNLAEYWYRLRGEEWTQAMYQGFDEKFQAIPWQTRPVPTVGNGDIWECRSSVFALLKKEAQPQAGRWRHPARGTQQIVDRMCAVLNENGGEFLFGASAEQLTLAGGHVESVSIRTQNGLEAIATSAVISAIPVMRLATLLGKETPELSRADHNKKRYTLVAYVVADAPPRFPHAWLEVSCPGMKIGRVTNYARFGGVMVPCGKTALALEVFTDAADPLLTASDDVVLEALVSEVCATNLIEKKKIRDRLLIRIPGCEASNSCSTWKSEPFRRLTADLKQINNLYDVNRAGIDISVFAGLLAGHAAVSRNRERFDSEADPAQSSSDHLSRVGCV